MTSGGKTRSMNPDFPEGLLGSMKTQRKDHNGGHCRGAIGFQHPALLITLVSGTRPRVPE